MFTDVMNSQNGTGGGATWTTPSDPGKPKGAARVVYAQDIYFAIPLLVCILI